MGHFVPPAILTRKQAIFVVAIPQQMQFMVSQGYLPAWPIFARSTAWGETIENLELTKKEQDEYRDMWNHLLKDFAQKGAQ